MTQKVLVTGSNGFLGKSVCQHLSDFGYKIKQFDLCNGHDILNYNQVIEALTDCNVCIHLAAVSDLYEADSNPKRCHDINVNGTLNIAKACLQTGTRLLYASTCCAYGNNNMKTSNEDSPVFPTELYAETKLQGEKVIEQVGCKHNILRLATFYGPKMRDSLATSVFIKKTLAEQVIEIHGDGTQTRCYTHVDDIACGIRIILESKNAPKLVNISDETPYSVNQLVDIISEISGKKPIVKYVDDRDGQIKSSVINSDRLKRLGWKSKWDLKSGLSDCLKEFV